jgi:osmotically-inducible protein OsmY
VKKLIISLFCLFLLSSCVESVIVGSIATTAIAVRVKSISNSRDDVVITTKILRSLAKNNLKMPGNMIDITVDEGRILLTGIVKDKKYIKIAIDEIWKVKNVKEIINEIEINDNFRIFISAKQYIKDSFITSRIESKILANKDLDSFNYKIITVNNVVYLLGIANDNDDIDNITSLVAKIKNVKKVVSHIILKNDKRRNS